MSFSALGLSEPIVRAVSEHGYTTPTPIQLQAIPAVLNGGDLLAGAQTGTGKTAGFTLPILQRLLANPRAGKKVIRVLVLTPTRELAAQVEESVRTYGKYAGVKSTVIYGGVGINPQISILRQGVDVLVATPGRLLDHHQQRTVDLSHVEILVLDEADRMLDMGFIHDIKKILAVLPKKRQNLLFSATFSEEIKKLADGLLDNPALIEVARRNSTVEMITQKVHPVDRDKKKDLLIHLIKQNNWHQVLVFTRTKHGANRLAEQLNKSGITALAIHGNKSQAARTKALAEFKTGDLAVLVATDIAARGIDIDQLHRIGRTGRAGATGEAISLVCVDEKKMFYDIERLIKRDVESVVIPGFEPDPNAKPEPIQLRSQDHQPRGRSQGRGQGAGRGGSGGAGGGTAARNKPRSPSDAGRRPLGEATGGQKRTPSQGGQTARTASNISGNGAGGGANTSQARRAPSGAKPPATPALFRKSGR
jgi:ATP-dependent RNA helicase RhlE